MSSLCDYSEACILFNGITRIVGRGPGAAADERNKMI